jgi:hypothetical protein
MLEVAEAGRAQRQRKVTEQGEDAARDGERTRKEPRAKAKARGTHALWLSNR